MDGLYIEGGLNLEVVVVAGTLNVMPAEIYVGSDPLTDTVHSGEVTTFTIQVKVVSPDSPPPVIEYQVRIPDLLMTLW